MSSNSGVGPHRTTGESNKQSHHRKADPGRGLACTECRAKKQLCDRKKPACTTCIELGIECEYRKRKLPASVPELEGVVQRLEREYESGLKKRKRPRISFDKQPSDPDVTTSTRNNQEGHSARGSSFSRPSGLPSQPFNDPTLSERLDTSTDGEIRGYFMNESFLTVPAPIHLERNSNPMAMPFQELPSITPTLPSSSGSWLLQHSITHPIRVFAPVSPRMGSSRLEDPSITGVRQGIHLHAPPSLQGDEGLDVTRFSSVGQHSNNQWPVDPPGLRSQLQSLFDVSTDGEPTDTNLEKNRSALLTLLQTYTDIVPEPSLSFSRATWWDYLIHTYTIRPNTLSSLSRQAAALEISQDVFSFFKKASIWLHFLHAPLFFTMFHHSEQRDAMQPALVLSILAYSKLLQSNRDMITTDIDQAERERMWRQSIMLRGLAQASFDASYNAGWIDTPLAQAAWIMALYEISAHKDRTINRKVSAIILLDNILRVLGLTSIDTIDPRVSTFADRVPAIGRPSRSSSSSLFPEFNVGSSALGVPSNPTILPEATPETGKYQANPPSPTPFDLFRPSMDQSPTRPGTASTLCGTDDNNMRIGCPCQVLSLAGNPEAARCTPMWRFMPSWGHSSNPTLAEIRQEEARRVVWSAVVLLGTDAASRIACGLGPLDLHISKAENFAVMFPGEEAYATLSDVNQSRLGKESIWALLGRTMLLWLTCVRHISKKESRSGLDPFLASGRTEIGQDDADFAMRTWMETLALEEAMDVHRCNAEEATFFEARDYIFTIRMLISKGFRQYIPVPQSGAKPGQVAVHHALKSITYQTSMGNSICNMIASGKASRFREIMANRPFLSWLLLTKMWRVGAARRLVEDLESWEGQQLLSIAMDDALSFVPVLRWFEDIWPCPEDRRNVAKAMNDLEHICGLLGRKMP